MTVIITKSNSEEIVERIIKHLTRSPVKLIRIEGVCGSGKTTIGRELAKKGIGLHIETDTFATQQVKDTPYPQCLRQRELDAAIERAFGTDQTVILDGVCLGEVAPVRRWGRGSSIYVKRLSFNSADPIWHVGYDLEDEPPLTEPHRSVDLYHREYKPHMTADFIVEFPEDGHRLPDVMFSRERCFDPRDSEVT